LRLAAHELHDLRELILSCCNTITNMEYFLNHVQDQELGELIQRHLPLHIQDYNMKVQCLSNQDGPSERLNVPPLVLNDFGTVTPYGFNQNPGSNLMGQHTYGNGAATHFQGPLSMQTQNEANHSYSGRANDMEVSRFTGAMKPDMWQTVPQSMTPRTNVQELDDHEIATSYLLTLKRAGREYAWAAMEVSNPNIRLFLEDAFRMASHHAYQVWQWLHKRGYYPIHEAPQQVINTMNEMFRPVQMPAMPQMQREPQFTAMNQQAGAYQPGAQW
jgi:spore coat protein CotF